MIETVKADIYHMTGTAASRSYPVSPDITGVEITLQPATLNTTLLLNGLIEDQFICEVFQDLGIKKSDKIVINSEEYRVQATADWSQFGFGHVKLQLTKSTN